ncbi:free fatty acid receptor 2-like [Acipenser oxyrinchus oxyrinchus]|uniref:Free fatty acid receptor 2-like n=1 Tax=Acipenser oxyrinchus oxyrinchus TaxID=40147 RepID=A0AAD8FVV4_ACIOX|nr:free fatty acid receptor 2-like [Acipenser oxyrinchus oxyrinchus]
MALTSHNQLILSVYIVTFVTGLPANILAFYTFSMKVHHKPAPIDILLLNLTVSDLIFLLFLPFRMVEVLSGSWVLPNFLCPLSGFIFYSTIYISTFFLMGVSVERYLGVAYPIKYKINHKPMYAIMVSVFFWVISAAHCSIVYIVQYQKPGNGTHNVSSCYEEFTKEQLNILLPVRFEMCLVLFCIPFLITSFCYISFIRILTTLPNISHRRKQRAIGLALGTLLVFILCFCPYNISHVVGFVKWESPAWRVDALLPSTFNACLDPIIFYFSSSEVQNNVRNCISGVLGRIRPINLCKRLCPAAYTVDEQTESSFNNL